MLTEQRMIPSLDRASRTMRATARLAEISQSDPSRDRNWKARLFHGDSIDAARDASIALRLYTLSAAPASTAGFRRWRAQ